MPADATALPAELIAFIQSGMSITVAGRDDRLVSSIAKGAGCRVAADGREITLLLFAEAAEPVLRDVATNRHLAVVFSQPSTHRTVQLKGCNAQCVPTLPADLALVRQQLALFAADLGRLGWDHQFVQAAFWHDPSQLVAIRFTPDGAFAQTPGPGAGAPMSLKASGS